MVVSYKVFVHSKVPRQESRVTNFPFVVVTLLLIPFEFWVKP